MSLLTCLNPCRYENPEVALNCGMMLRECLRHEPLARTVLYSEDFFCFFRYVELSTFDIASDAFASFKVPVPTPVENFYQIGFNWTSMFLIRIFLQDTRLCVRISWRKIMTE